MTNFKGFLIDKGYGMYVFNCKEMKYQKANQHTISTMVNLDHRYIHNTDINLLDKINKGKSVMDEDFTWEDRKGEICFGLHEKDKPCTLISPVMKPMDTLILLNEEGRFILIELNFKERS